MPDPSENFEPQGDINFVTHEEPKSGALVDQIFTWTIARGRTVIVITAVIVMLLFVVRQKVKNDLDSVIDEIGPNKAIVENSMDKEKDYRDTQERVDIISGIINSQVNWRDRLDWFDKKVPDSVVKNNVVFESDTISFSGDSPNSDGFRNLIVNLITDDRVRTIVIKGSRYVSDTGGYTFEIEVLLNK